MLRSLKLVFIRVANSLGVSSLLLESPWRRRRLLIICYHGTSILDEHEWDGSLYIPQSLLRQRLELLRRTRANVLPLDEAIQRLPAGDLPERSVVITYDDGTYDFYSRAYPLLADYGFPVTLYITTYYSEYNRPVFDVVISYLLWKARGGKLRWKEVFGNQEIILTPAGRESARAHILDFSGQNRLSAAVKDGLAAELAERLGVDYSRILDRRILHLISREEAAELARNGVDLQLHTHRHRVSQDRDLFRREIEDNRARVDPLRGSPARHFCYPGGVHRPEFLRWLRECGVVSATTCEPGLAEPGCELLLLPRMVDTSAITPMEFTAWLSGFASLLPHRPYRESAGQLVN